MCTTLEAATCAVTPDSMSWGQHAHENEQNSGHFCSSHVPVDSMCVPGKVWITHKGANTSIVHLCRQLTTPGVASWQPNVRHRQGPC